VYKPFHNVILSKAKNLGLIFEPTLAKENEQRCLKARPHASHFVAALA
jgi:hypothetical protein